MYAACYPDCLYGAIGFGAVLQQRYTLFSTAFFNFVPEEGWTLVADRQAEPPQ